jgi:hypothetical protein
MNDENNKVDENGVGTVEVKGFYMQGVTDYVDITTRPREWFYNLLKDDKLQEAWNGEPFSYAVILPTKEVHASDFAIMNFILFNRANVPLAKVTGGIDVFESRKETDDWVIDCLPCGLLRFFYRDRRCEVHFNLGSNFEITVGDYYDYRDRI